jgi:hypothetical protein
LYIWQVDAESGGTAPLAAQDRIGDILTHAEEAAGVFSALMELARDWAPQAARIDVQMLRAALEERHYALNHVPARAAAFRALESVSADVLDTSAVRLGRQLLLPRDDLRAKIRDSVAEHEVSILSGRAGVGKSMLGRLVAEGLRSDGAVVVGIDLRGSAASLSALEADLGVSLRDGLAGAPVGTQRLLIVDGAEQALSDAGRLLKSILNVVPSAAGGAPPWRILITARDEAAQAVISIVRERISDTNQLNVGELTDEEVELVVREFPALATLQRNPRAEALLLRRPYLVELLIRSSALEALPDGVVGEEDLVDVVTTRLVRRDHGGLPGRGAPDARSDIYLVMASAAASDALPVRLDARDGEAIQGLLSDDVIAPTRPTQLSWRFAHDVLVDYAVATALAEPGGREMLAVAGRPRRLIRAVRLWMQRELADAWAAGTLVDVWGQVTSDVQLLADRDGVRWIDVAYEALLHMGKARNAIAQLSEVLIEREGAGLLRLLDVAERLARLNITYDANRPAPLDSALTGSVVDLLASLKGRVPARCLLRAARLVHHHLAAAFAYDHNSQKGLEAANELPTALISWAGQDEYGDVLEYCLGSLGFLGNYLNPTVEEFVAQHARDRPHLVAELVESPGSGAALSRSRPDLMLRFAGLYYLGRGLHREGVKKEVGWQPRPSFSSSSPFLFGDEDEELSEEGVRDHDPRQAWHLDMFPLGNNQANPELGPFLALLTAQPDSGFRLVGAVTDAATKARERLEAGFRTDIAYDTRVVQLSLKTVDSDTVSNFSGPATVWCWHRRTTVGPGPAQSALMALRKWASAQVRDGRGLGEVVAQILDVGESLAFPAVAWFLMLEHLDLVDDEMDQFLVQPEIWSLENHRCVNESSGTALPVPEVATRLGWGVSLVAMQLVLRAAPSRRDRLAELGNELVDRARNDSTIDESVAQRWASELNIANYRTEPKDDGYLISVEYDPAVVEALEKAGAAAQQNLSGMSLMHSARAIRDAEADAGSSQELWHQIKEHLEQNDSSDLYTPADIRGAAAAAILRAARNGIAVETAVLQEAVSALLAAAEAVTAYTPPPLKPEVSSLEDRGDESPVSAGNERFIRDMAWDVAFDRSVATALPWLLADETLMAQAEVSPQQVSAAVIQAANSPYSEARARLAKGMVPLWQPSNCAAGSVGHQTVVAVATRFVETSGYGPISAQGLGYSQVTLPDPVGEFLQSSNELVLDLDAASHAVVLLETGSTIGCAHGVEAANLLDALINYDERVWPEHYARRHYSGTSRWRTQIDRAVARRILAGDDDALQRRLDGFADVGEELTGLLAALPEEATDADSASRLHSIWTQVLDRLLPSARNLDGMEAGGRKRPYHRDVDELDRALLLVPEKDVNYWPWAQTVTLSLRWLKEFKGRPDMADRAITYSGRLFGLPSELCAQISLDVLGTNFEWIKRDSSLAAPFLQITLRAELSENIRGKARGIIDGLAAIGDEFALEVQRSLES